MQLAERLGAVVRRERERLGWTQEHLANAAGVSVRQLIKIEAGRANLTLGTAEALAGALGVVLLVVRGDEGE